MESTARTQAADPADQTTAVHTTVAAGGREQCSNCGAMMAADQRYCIECGQRRGAPRFPFMETGAQGHEVVAAPPTRPRLSTNGTLIAGIGTLLLAMGIGVLIGRTGNNSGSKVGGAPIQVTVAGAGAGATGAAGAAAVSTPSTTSSSAALANGAKNAKANHTSTKGTFTTKAPAPKVTTVGSPCSGNGHGCQGGKFTGNFFGG